MESELDKLNIYLTYSSKFCRRTATVNFTYTAMTHAAKDEFRHRGRSL